MFRRILTCFGVVSFGITMCLGGQEADQTTRSVREGQDFLYRLEYAAAARIYQQRIQQAPDDPVAYGMLAIVRWNELLFRAGNLALDDYATPTPFSEEPAKLRQPDVRAAQDLFHQTNSQLLEVCEKRLQRNAKDALALYFKGVHFENLSGEAVAVTKSSSDAIAYGNRANELHKSVLKLDPGFTDAYISVASHEFARATLPWSIRWLAFLLLGRANKERALEWLTLVADKGKYRQLDARVILALLHSWKGEAPKAIEILRGLRTAYPENYLIDINMAAILEQKLKDPQAALRVYQDLQKNQKSKAWSLCPGEIHYRMGKIYLRLRDDSLALAEFQQALKAKKAERETEPLAYFRMAQIYENRRDRAQALDCYRRVLSYQGTELRDELGIARSKVK
jgi:tetratricopeptide (TPR) repeat protein